jgi:hypothetical protein
MPRTLFTLRCQATGESQSFVVCDQHARDMPSVDGDRVAATAAKDDAGCMFCRRRHPAAGATLEILIGHVPGNGGWHALAPGASSGGLASPWRALADAIMQWHCAGRPRGGGVYFGGPPHSTAAGTVAEEARAAWVSRTDARTAA